MEEDILERILDGRDKPSNIPLPLLRSITQHFSEERQIGKGGFGTVYKGILPNGTVAVKRIMNIHTIDDKLFHREVNSLMKINHQNIVRFLGFCSNTEHTYMEKQGSGEYIYAEIRERLLCFEYINNGSLDRHITDELRGLKWNIRYEIIRGICEGLHHLHDEKHIIHMDLKPANILLDEHMVPKLTDFGLSRPDEISRTTTSNRFFSLGYCAPEYLNGGRMSIKSDIYSLGIIIIELVTGSKNIPNSNNVLRRWRHRWKKSAQGTPLEYQQVNKCIEIALLCQSQDPYQRPYISDIIRGISQTGSTNQLISTDNSTFGEISTYPDDGMLGIEPLEIHFPFEHNQQISPSFELTNETDDYIAFLIQTMRPLKYCTEPEKGIVPPRSKSSVNITLQVKENADKDVIMVRSTRVNEGLVAEDITIDIFSQENGDVVDDVNLDVIFSSHRPNSPGHSEESQNGLSLETLALSSTGKMRNNPEVSDSDVPQSSAQTGPGVTVFKISSSASNELVKVDPLELIFPFGQKIVLFSVNVVNITDDYVGFNLNSSDDNGRYTSYPMRGILSPGTMRVIHNTRTSQEGAPSDPKRKKWFVVSSIIVSKDLKESDLTYDMFYRGATTLVHHLERPIFLVAPPGQQTWEVTPYVIPLVSPIDKQDGQKSNGNDSRMSSSASNDLIHVDHHEFILPSEQKVVTFFLNLVNVTDDYVSFHVSNLDFALYISTPQKGILSPRSSLKLHNVRISLEGPLPEKKIDAMYFVGSIVVNKDFKETDITFDMFNKQLAPTVVHEVKLPIFLVAPLGPQTWEVTPDASFPLISSKDKQDCQKSNDKDSQIDSRITWVNSMDVHPTEPWIVTTQQDHYVHIWNYHTQQVKRFSLIGASQATSVKFVPGEQWIVAGTMEGFIYVHNYDPLEQIHVLKAHSGSVNCLAIHPTEPYFLSASLGGEIQLRDFEEGLGLTETFRATIWCARSVVFDPSGTNFASACGDSIKIWNFDFGECELVLSGHSHEVTCLEYFTHGDKLYLISGSQDGTAKIWDCLQEGRCVKTLKVYSPVRAVYSHPDLPILITGSYDGSVRLWNSTTFRRQRILNFDLGGVNTIACLKGSTRIVIGHYHGLAFAEIGSEESTA